jgi:uncharacterized membrane protein
MNFDKYCQWAGVVDAKRRKNLILAYLLITISGVFFFLFFKTSQELPVFLSALLLDVAAIVCLYRAVCRTCPIWQMILAKNCVTVPSQKSLYEFVAALECPHRPMKYGKSAISMFKEAFIACSANSDISEEDKQLLAKVLRTQTGLDRDFLDRTHG